MIYIESLKDKTKDKAILPISEPEKLLLPLFEQFGSKPEVTVKVGEKVRKYQVLGKSSEGLSQPVHSPVSGTVEEIEKRVQVDGSKALTITIRNDYKEEEYTEPLRAIDPENPREILGLINEAGIVGLGGAQFPTANKYDRKGKKVKTFILNGAECEPFLTNDYALMKERSYEILEGIRLANKVLEAEETIIAFEENNKDLEQSFGKYLSDPAYSSIRTQIVPDEYPQGGELQLTKTVTGVVMPNDSIPLDYGIVISNVGTVYAIYEAVVNRKPLIERIITVSGEKISQPGNYKIKIGTPVSHIIQSCTIATEEADLIAGGPMMSPHIRDFSVPLHKGSLGLIALTRSKIDRLPCIWCGYCVDVCPMYLMPMKYDQFFRQGKYRRLADYDINDCIECGSCEYVCPSNVPLMKSIKEGKQKIKEIDDVSDKKTV